MSAKRINSGNQGAWNNQALSRYLRLGQFHILGFRETAWFYVVGLTTAILIFSQHNNTASATGNPPGSNQEAVNVQALGNTEIEYKTVAWEPFEQPDRPKILILAMNMNDLSQSGTNIVTTRIRQNNPRQSDGRRSARIRTITSITTMETPPIPTPPDQPHAISLQP